jgi:DNA-binding PadR family transcriptional regulator
MNVDAQLPLTPLSFQILLALADAPRHGYGIIKDIEAASGAPFASSTGTLYLAIQRLEQQELIAAVPAAEAPEAHDPRRRYYGLTDLGREVAAAEAQRLAGLLGVARDRRLLTAKALLSLTAGKKG